MNILIDIIHPAHVHFFRFAIEEFHQRGHTVAVTAREKDVTIALLENFGIPYTLLSKVGKGRMGLLKELLVRDWRLWRFCRKFKPDVLTGISGIFAAHVGFLLGKPSIVWDDTEHQKQAHAITYPLATAYHCPEAYTKQMGEKQHFYPGCHDLAYLHPRRFTPDRDVVTSLGIDPTERYCIVRLISWGAHHDVGQYGLADEKKLNFIRTISQYARCYITSEGLLPSELEPYRLRIPPHHLHHVLAFADLCIAEGGTVATEANALGVPSIYINTLGAGVFEMFKEYGLLWQITDTDQALEKAVELLQDEETPERCRAAREKLLNDKIDVTGYIVQTIEKAVQQGDS
jgi:predicted glycosyltransferase